MREFQGNPERDRRIPSILEVHRNRPPDGQGAPKQRTGLRYESAETVWRVRGASPVPQCAAGMLENRSHRKEGNSEMFPYTCNILQQIAGGELRETNKCRDFDFMNTFRTAMGWLQWRRRPAGSGFNFSNMTNAGKMPALPEPPTPGMPSQPKS